jgi:hypothetical protein
MKIPFNTEQFLDVFKAYNDSVFPAQIIFYASATAVIFFIFKNPGYTSAVISSLLAFFWMWMGIVYHIIFFSTINKAAYAFGILFITQGMLFFYYGILKKSFTFGYRSGLPAYAGIAFICYSLIIYPLAGYAAGHVYPQSPTFGLPCPTTIFTFGILLLTVKNFPLVIIIIPVIWSVIGFFAALYLGIYEDTGLIISGVFSLILLLLYSKRTVTR